MVKRLLLVALMALVSLGGSPVKAEAYVNPSLGSADAPVVIDDYGSFTCGHCGAFFHKAFPKLQETFIKDGSVRVVFHSFPLGRVSLLGAALVRCLPKDQQMSFTELLYKNQDKWMVGGKELENLKQYAMLAGLSADDIDACLVNNKIIDAILAERVATSKKYDIQGTPTFVFNGGEEILVGSQSFEAFESVIKKILKGKK